MLLQETAYWHDASSGSGKNKPLLRYALTAKPPKRNPLHQDFLVLWKDPDPDPDPDIPPSEGRCRTAVISREVGFSDANIP
jgi:hypothetical protein